jgi:phage portal protein BeeE
MGPVTLKVDEDQISELAEDRAKLWTQVEAASFLSDAEKRDMLGFPVKKEDPHPTLSRARERAK